VIPPAPIMHREPITKRALLIGINKYYHLSTERQLRGCLQDVELLSDLLQSRFEFDPSNIVTVLDECATREGILKAFTDFIATVQTDDIIVVQYCGHGSYIADATKGSGWTETIVPCDSGRASSVYPSTDIKDMEINEFLIQPLISKTPNLTLFFDTCHSGSIIRDDFANITRSIDPDGEIRRNRGAGRAGRSGWPTAENYTLLAACRADEGAHETFREGVSYGAFTYQLCSVIKESRSEQLRTLFQVASAALTAKYPSQHPILEGCRNGHIFGTDRLETLRYLTVLGTTTTGERQEVQMDGGLASGVTLHSVWAARPLGASASESDVRVQVHRVLPFESYAYIISDGTIQPGSQCFEISHVYGEASLSVWVHTTAEGTRSEEIHALFQTPNVSGALKRLSDTESATADVKLAFLKPRSAATEGDMAPQLGLLNNGTWIALARDGETLIPPTPKLDDVFENLRKLARYRFGLDLRNVDEANSLRGKLSLKLRQRTNKNDTWRDATVGEDGFPFFRCGEHIACVITNNSDDVVYPYILEFAEDGSVSQRYPGQGGEERLDKGMSTREVAPMRLNVSKDSYFQLAGDRFLATDKHHQKRVTEVLKLFASTERIDLSLLLQSSFSRHNLHDRGLAKLLRKGDPLSETASTSWETVDAPFVLEI
jgi:Caspase domain